MARQRFVGNWEERNEEVAKREKRVADGRGMEGGWKGGWKPDGRRMEGGWKADGRGILKQI